MRKRKRLYRSTNLLFLGVLIGLMTINHSWGQSSSAIEGVLLNETGETLPGVHITIPELSVGVVSDSSGRFRLTGIPAGSHQIRFSMVGFQTLTQDLVIEENETIYLEITLTPMIFTSGELVVTASRRSQLIGTVSASMNTITPEELHSRNIISLDQALDHVPGVQVLGNSVNIRGSSGFAYGVGSRVLLLVDGVPLMGPDQGGFDFDGLPLTQTRQIEVLKSPGSALYGGGALGGVINLITNDFQSTPETTLRFYSGFYQPVRFDQWKESWDEAADPRPFTGLLFGRSHQVSNRFGYWFSGKLQQDSGYLQNNETKGIELYSKIGFNITDQADLSLYSSVRRNRNQQFLYWNGLSDPLRPGEIQLGNDSATGSNEGLSDRITLLPVFTHRIQPSLEYILKGRLFGVAFRPIDSEGNVRPSEKHNVGVRYGGEIQVNIDPTDQMMITTGVTFDENYIRSDVFVGEDSLMVRNQPEGALFFQAEYQWSQKLTTTAGFRYDAYQVHTLETATQFSPKFSTSYRITENFTARASFGRGFRVPSVAERFFSNRDFFPLESNLALRPETSTGYETGLTWFNLIHARYNIKADLTGFWNEYRELVEPTFIQNLGAFQFVNLTRARIRGLEASVAISDVEQNHHISIGYTLLDPIDLELNRALVYRSKHLFQLSSRLLILSWLETGVDFRAASAPDAVDSDFSFFVPDAELFPSLYVTDLRTRFFYEQAGKSFGLSGTLIVRNLLDYYYIERPAIFAPPRSLQIVIELTF
jgi:outer membrane receptor for ferrienterochelin and colicins